MAKKVISLSVLSKKKLFEHVKAGGEMIVRAEETCSLNAHRQVVGKWSLFSKGPGGNPWEVYKQVVTAKDIEPLYVSSLVGLFNLSHDMGMPDFTVPVKEGDHVLWQEGKSGLRQDDSFPG